MSYIPLDKLSFGDSTDKDAFGRLRTSFAESLICIAQDVSYHPLTWDHYTASGGTATHSTATASTVLRTNASTSGARALRQTKPYYRYVPGKTQLLKVTGTLRKGSVPSGTAFSALGYYDDENGVFFRDSSAGVAVVTRSNVSGSVVDTAVLQSSWNVDKLDGTGPSGITVDWTKEQLFLIDLLWLGAGRVRFCLVFNGTVFPVHYSNYANLITSVYMRTSSLPIRGEVFNSGGAGSDIQQEFTCCSLEAEGGTTDEDYIPTAYSAYISSSFSADTTLRPVATRRLRDTFNGRTVHGHSHLNEFTLLVGTNPVYWEIRYNTTVVIGSGGAATTNNVDTTHSISEYDTYTGANNTVSGGLVIYNGLIGTGTGSTKIAETAQGSDSQLKLGRTYSGVRDTYTFCARSVTGNASLSIAVSLKEQY